MRSTDAVQPTWKAIKSAARNVPGGNEVQLEDVQTMADLCPDVVILRDPHQYAFLAYPSALLLISKYALFMFDLLLATHKSAHPTLPAFL